MVLLPEWAAAISISNIMRLLVDNTIKQANLENMGVKIVSIGVFELEIILH